MVKTILVWALAYGGGLFLFFQTDWRFLNQPGVYLDPNYRGLFYSSLVPGIRPRYAKAVALHYHLGGWALLPMLIRFVRARASLNRDRDYRGNLIGKPEMDRILQKHREYERVQTWKVTLTDRNKVWVGIDLLTGEDVFMEGEQLFRGTLIIGAQATGKTSRFFKVILKQLGMDPAHKTAFVVFTLKNQDSREFRDYLKSLGQASIPWSMCNILDLAVDRTGGMEQGRVQGLLQGAALASGFSSKTDPFWLNSSIRRLIEAIYALARERAYPTLGRAYARFAAEVAAKGDDARMDQGLLETLNAALGGMRDPSARMAVLHSPAVDGGLHLGPLFAAGNAAFREITPFGILDRNTGPDPENLPPGLYELPAGVRLGFDWRMLLNPLSVVLPPPGGGSKGELFALNFIKLSLLSWIGDDMASPRSRLLTKLARDRFRIVLAQDEAQNFLALGGEGMTDTKALQEQRQAGLVSLSATQAMSALMKGTKEQNEAFLSVNGTYFFLGVSGPERKRVIETIGKVKVTRIRRSYGRSEETGGQTTDARGNVRAQNTRANVTESVQEELSDFITPEDYGRFPGGVAIMVTHGAAHRIVYCPYHDRVHIERKPS